MKKLVLSVALLSLLAATPVGSKVKPISPQEVQTLTNSRLVSQGLSNFSMVELRYPDSYEELCQSPHMPVRCSDIENPYSHRAVRDAVNSPGDLHFERTVKGLRMTNFHDSKKSNGDLDSWSLEFHEGLEKRLQSIDEMKKAAPRFEDPALKTKGIPFPDRTAYSVGCYLQIVAIWIASDTGGYYPRGWGDLTGMMAKSRASIDRKVANISWEVEKIRNDFTGGYAQAVSSPSPGNFQYGYDPAKNTVHLQVFGTDGKVVFEYTFLPPNPPSPEVTKWHPVVPVPLP